jgi:glutamate/tyrosine decarboxylase-like PLP-dependent enzyme
MQKKKYMDDMEKEIIDKKSDMQEKMFLEMENKNLFNQAKDYAFDYADKALGRNVFPTNEAIKGLMNFDEGLPEKPSHPSDILGQLHKYGSPATVSSIGGRYFGFVTGAAIPMSLATKWLSDIWDQNVPLYLTSPIASKLESVVENWLKQIFNMPQETVVGFVSGSSMAILCGLAAARYRILKRLGWDVNSKGLYNAPKVRVVAGMQAHGTVVKAVSILGLGKDNIEWVEVDGQGRIIPEKIPALDENTMLVLQAGNVNSGSFDFFDEICAKAQKAKTWVHIDGAIGLFAAGCEKLKYLTSGIEKAHSWSVDGHKTLNTPYDCGIVWCV